MHELSGYTRNMKADIPIGAGRLVISRELLFQLLGCDNLNICCVHACVTPEGNLTLLLMGEGLPEMGVEGAAVPYVTLPISLSNIFPRLAAQPYAEVSSLNILQRAIRVVSSYIHKTLDRSRNAT